MANKVVAVDFISSEMFKCLYCNTRVQYPVMKVENVGIFCGSCISKTEYKDAEINEDMHSMLLDVKLFCKYVTKGCPKQCYFKEISEHETICDYRDKMCPFSILNFESSDCCGVYEDILSHIKEKHKDSIKIFDNYHYNFNFNYNSQFETIRILLFNNEHYFIFYVAVKGNKLMFFVYFIGNLNETNNFKFTIQNRGCNLLTKPQTMFLLHDSMLNEKHIKNESIIFDLDFLKSTLRDNFETIVTINKEGFKINTNSLLEYMECPVCKDSMKCEISLCKTGHSVCIKCRKNLKRCPLCLGSFSSARNYVVESISNLIDVPINYKSIYPKRNDQNHICNSCNYSCPFSNSHLCEWHGQYKDIIEHLRIEHINIIFYNHQMTRTISFVGEVQDVVCLITLGYIFKVTTKKDKDKNKMFIRFEVIGQSRADKYNYRITTNARYHAKVINCTVPIFSMKIRPEYVTFAISIRTLVGIVKSDHVVITYGISQ
nr:uncharacterized protein LOC111416303 [Onthophagus taurus]